MTKSILVEQETIASQIAALLELKWSVGETITYYDVESPYKLEGKQWPGRFVRPELIAICQRLYESGKYDSDFWEGFLSCAPSEAGAITNGTVRSSNQ